MNVFRLGCVAALAISAVPGASAFSYRMMGDEALLTQSPSVLVCAAEPAADSTVLAARAEPVVDRTGKYLGPRTGAGPSAGEASRVYIDPKTREIIDRPVDADPVISSKSTNYIDYTIRASEEGYLFIDTSNNFEVSRASLNADGEIEYACGLDHDHSKDSR